MQADLVKSDACVDIQGAAWEGNAVSSHTNCYSSSSANVYRENGPENQGYRLTESSEEGGVRGLGGVGALFQRLSRLGSGD